MKSNVKTNLKIAAATAMCIFTLGVVFTSVYAWFVASKRGDVSGMTFNVINNSGTDVQTMTVHKCNLSASTSSVLQFDPTPSVTMSGSGEITGPTNGIVMNNYSYLNQTEPVLLLLSFREGVLESDLNVTATTEATAFVSAATSANVDAFPFSSAVTFKSATYSSSVTSFPFNNVQVSNYSNDISFAQFDSQGSPTGFNSELTLLSNGSNTEISYMAIILDYYPTAIDYIIKHTNADVFVDHENYIGFLCDWIFTL